MSCFVGLNAPLWEELAVLNSYCGIETGPLLFLLGDAYDEYCGLPGKSCPDPDGKNSSEEFC